jgi:hypothetical protein
LLVLIGSSPKYICKLERIVFSDAAAAIFVKNKTKGTRSTKRHATKGRGGTDKISLWRELIVMNQDKGLAVSAALDLLAASEILSSAALNHRKKWISIEFGLASRNSHTGQKSAITEFRTSWGGLISRLLWRQAPRWVRRG